MASSTSIRPTASPPLYALPLHLLANVLEELGTVQHIPPVLLSHPIFHAAFNDFPSLTRNVLRAQLPDDEIFVIALLAHESHPARRARRNVDACTFLRTYRDDPHSLVASHRYIRLTEARRIGDLHSAVSDLRDEVLRRTLTRLYAVDNGKCLPDIEAVSVQEVRRVERALYRFQMYCNLFSDKFRKGTDDVESKRIFFDQYSSWVNEQLGCVYDCLETQLGEALDLVTAEKGDDAKCLIEGGKQRRRQHYLSLGLPLLHRLLMAPTTDDKYQILCAAMELLSANVPMPIAHVQNEHKYREPASSSEWSIDVNQLARETDTDDGPRNTWEATHRGGARNMFFKADYEIFLRRLGYVMWDQRRVDEDICRETLAVARQNSTPTFLSPGRLMNVARSWDKQFRPLARVAPRSNGSDRCRPAR